MSLFSPKWVVFGKKHLFLHSICHFSVQITPRLQFAARPISGDCSIRWFPLRVVRFCCARKVVLSVARIFGPWPSAGGLWCHFSLFRDSLSNALRRVFLVFSSRWATPPLPISPSTSTRLCFGISFIGILFSPSRSRHNGLQKNGLYEWNGSFEPSTMKSANRWFTVNYTTFSSPLNNGLPSCFRPRFTMRNPLFGASPTASTRFWTSISTMNAA